MANIYHRILFGRMKWKAKVDVEIPEKCIMCVAPHTSNWDFIIGELYIRAIGSKANFLMKREWFFWPLGKLLRRMGGIPVWRDRKTGMTEKLAELATREMTFRLAVTPEGTRSLATKWKRGFYHIAQKAGIPILLFAVDYKNRCIVCTKQIYPTGDEAKEMKEIMDYYRYFSGKHPEKFSIEEIEA